MKINHYKQIKIKIMNSIIQIQLQIQLIKCQSKLTIQNNKIPNKTMKYLIKTKIIKNNICFYLFKTVG